MHGALILLLVSLVGGLTLEDYKRSENIWGAWGAWGACNCVTDLETRTRMCKDDTCAGTDTDQRKCANESACPVDGGWTAFTDWSVCDVTCGGGRQARVRFCTNPPPTEGGICRGEAREIRDCNTQSCQASTWGHWGSWTACDCTDMQETRSRVCQVDSQCIGSDTEMRKCVNDSACPVHSGWTNYTEWSACDVTCGGGKQTRIRFCTDPSPINDGFDCLDFERETRKCNTQHCPVWLTWSSWSNCTENNGHCWRTRIRHCSTGNDTQCPGTNADVTICGHNECSHAPVDGGWSAFSDWMTCSVTCGNGTQVRFRLCNNPSPSGGGKVCVGDSVQSQPCNPAICPYWLPWQPLSPCKLTNGVCLSYRLRNCSTGDNHDCGDRNSDIVPCKLDQCIPAWSNWSTPSPCKLVGSLCLTNIARNCSTGRYSDCSGSHYKVLYCAQHCCNASYAGNDCYSSSSVVATTDSRSTSTRIVPTSAHISMTSLSLSPRPTSIYTISTHFTTKLLTSLTTPHTSKMTTYVKQSTQPVSLRSTTVAQKSTRSTIPSSLHSSTSSMTKQTTTQTVTQPDSTKYSSTNSLPTTTDLPTTSTLQSSTTSAQTGSTKYYSTNSLPTTTDLPTTSTLISSTTLTQTGSPKYSSTISLPTTTDLPTTSTLIPSTSLTQTRAMGLSTTHSPTTSTQPGTTSSTTKLTTSQATIYSTSMKYSTFKKTVSTSTTPKTSSVISFSKLTTPIGFVSSTSTGIKSTSTTKQSPTTFSVFRSTNTASQSTTSVATTATQVATTPLSSISSNLTSAILTSSTRMNFVATVSSTAFPAVANMSTQGSSSGTTSLSTKSANSSRTSPLLSVSTAFLNTTIKPMVTKPPNPIRCAVCAGPPEACELAYYEDICQPPNHYCINHVTNLASGDRLVDRRCGNVQDCYHDWYLGSSDDDKCRQLSSSSVLTYSFECSYCCVKDGCNVDMHPKDDTLYTVALVG